MSILNILLKSAVQERQINPPPPPTHPMHTHKDLKMPRLILFLKIVISTFKENYTDNFNFFNQ